MIHCETIQKTRSQKLATAIKVNTQVNEQLTEGTIGGETCPACPPWSHAKKTSAPAPETSSAGALVVYFQTKGGEKGLLAAYAFNLCRRVVINDDIGITLLGLSPDIEDGGQHDNDG